MGAVPAILNAVNDALAARGANLRSVPVRPDQILKLIREGQQ
jgi:CO/xanthine dehydrogenase Mo-binding subunit